MTFPEDLDLSSLIDLNLSGNQFTTLTFPKDLDLSSLRKLYLGSNQLTNLTLPNSLPNLIDLSLANNQLTNLTLPEGLTSLGWLNLDHNQFTTLTFIEGLTSLEALTLNGNPLTTLTFPEDLDLSSLRELYLWGTQLTNVVLPEGLTSLERIRLDESQLTTLTLRQGLTSLEYLDLRKNQLTNLTLPQGLTSLGHIDLDENQLTTLTLPEDLTNLQYLYLYLSRNPFKLLRVPAGMNIDNLNITPADIRIEFYGGSPPSPPDEPSSAPTLSYRRLANGLELSWESGVLQKSAGVEGPWEDVDETSPLRVSPLLSSEFFRLRAEGSSTPPPDPDLPTDPGSHPLPLNGSLEGSIDPVGEEDVYQITVTDSGWLTVFSTGSVDLYGRLLDSSGNELASDDDGGEDTNFRISHSVSAGTYYVRVRHYNNGGTGNYGITSRFVEPSRLPLNGSLEGSIDVVGEEDEYQITVTDSGWLTVFSTGSVDLYGRLLDSSGNELASDDDGGEDTNFRISHSVSAGTYYVRVRHYDNSGTGNYGITSRFE